MSHMLQLAAIFAAVMFGSEATPDPYCPTDYCIRRWDASTYTCEQYPARGYQCAYENDPALCTCAGKVKYGNYEMWGTEIDVAASTGCTNAVFNNTVNGMKFCWCTPSAPSSLVRSTRLVHFPHSGTANIPSGYTKATCMIGEVKTTLSVLVLTFLPGKVAEGAAHLAVPMALNVGFGSGGTKIVDFYLNNYTAVYQVNGVHYAKLDQLCANPAPLKAALVTATASMTDPLVKTVAGSVEWSIPSGCPAAPITTTVTTTPSTAPPSAANAASHIGAPLSFCAVLMHLWWVSSQ